MKIYDFYFEITAIGKKSHEVIKSESFRKARDEFFKKHQHHPHSIHYVWERDGKFNKLVYNYNYAGGTR